MKASSAVVKKAEERVTALYRARVPSWARYHTLNHTREVAASCEEIGTGMKLTSEEMEIVQLAAWFHDAGYVDGAEDHEERSAGAAKAFLQTEHVDERVVASVVGCIRATKIPQSPKNLLERVLCDSDVAYIGGDAFRAHSDALRTEWELRIGDRYTEEEWLKKNIEFVERCRFHTSYAQGRYGGKREENLRELQRRLAGLRRR